MAAYACVYRGRVPGLAGGPYPHGELPPALVAVGVGRIGKVLG